MQKELTQTNLCKLHALRLNVELNQALHTNTLQHYLLNKLSACNITTSPSTNIIFKATLTFKTTSNNTPIITLSTIDKTITSTINNYNYTINIDSYITTQILTTINKIFK